MDLRPFTLIDLAAALRERRIPPLELMDHVLARIEATRSTLNAVVTVRSRESLRAAARSMSVSGRRSMVFTSEESPLPYRRRNGKRVAARTRAPLR